MVCHARRNDTVTSTGPNTRPAGSDAAVVLGASLLARLLFLLLVPAGAHSVDADHWAQVFRLLEAGENPYAVMPYLNWPPVWPGVIYLIGSVAGGLGLSFLRVLQVFLIMVESLVIVSVLALVWELTPGANARRVVLWGIALNPVAVLLTCQHGNFDVIVALWIVLFVRSLVRFHRSRHPRAWLAACAFLGLGIVTKTVPLVLTALLANGWQSVPPRQRWLGGALVFAPVLLGVGFIYALAPEAVAQHVLRYRSLGGWFGVTGLLARAGLSWLIGAYGTLFNLLLIAILGATGLRLARRSASSEREIVLLAALLLLTIPALGPGYGPQYLQWSLPLLVALYPAYDARWRWTLGIAAIVAAGTYVVEYALFPSHGAFLAHLFEGSERVVEWGRAWSGPAAQTWIRLPLFAALLGVLREGERLVRREVASG
jgi:hypothetical protein